jgi:hypothetical protein
VPIAPCVTGGRVGLREVIEQGKDRAGVSHIAWLRRGSSIKTSSRKGGFQFA